MKKEKKNTKKKKFNLKFLKIIPLIIFIIPIVIFVIMKCSNTSYRINYFLFIFIEFLSLIYIFFWFKKKKEISKGIVTLFCIYCLVTFFLPMYSSTGLSSSNKENKNYLHGLEIQSKYKDMYGITIFLKNKTF